MVTMSDTLLAAVFLNFAGAAGSSTMLIGRQNLSPLTNKLFSLLIVGGAIAEFLAMFLFIKDQGLQYGAIYWGGSGLAFSFIVIFFLTGAADGLRSILAVLALGLGVYFAILKEPLAAYFAILKGPMWIAVTAIAVGVVIFWFAAMRKTLRLNNDPRQQTLIQLFLAAGRTGDLADQIKITNFLCQQGDWSLKEDRLRVAHALGAVERISDRALSGRARDIGKSIRRAINDGLRRGG